MTPQEVVDDLLDSVVEQVGDPALRALGFLLSELVENRGERQARAQRDLLAEPLVRRPPAAGLLPLLAVASGTDAAREVYQAEALGDALLDGVAHEDVALVAADSIGVDSFGAERLKAALALLRGDSLVSPAEATRHVAPDTQWLVTRAYERAVAPYVAEEIEGLRSERGGDRGR